MRILSECGSLTAAPKHVGVRQQFEARCGHVTGNVVENLQIGFDFTFFDNMLDAKPVLAAIGAKFVKALAVAKERRRRDQRR